MRVNAKWASRYDIHKIFGFFDPLSPCLNLELINIIKFTQSPFLCPLFHDPLPPPMRTSYLEAPNAIVTHGSWVVTATAPNPPIDHALSPLPASAQIK